MRVININGVEIPVAGYLPMSRGNYAQIRAHKKKTTLRNNCRFEVGDWVGIRPGHERCVLSTGEVAIHIEADGEGWKTEQGNVQWHILPNCELLTRKWDKWRRMGGMYCPLWAVTTYVRISEIDRIVPNNMSLQDALDEGIEMNIPVFKNQAQVLSHPDFIDRQGPYVFLVETPLQAQRALFQKVLGTRAKAEAAMASELVRYRWDDVLITTHAD